MAEKVDDEAQQENVAQEEAAIFPVTLATMIFQFVMFLTSVYYGMLFTNWGDAMIGVQNDGTLGPFSAGETTVGVKITSLVLAIIFFTISLTLPICCPNRIF